MTSRDPERSRSWPNYICMQLFQKPLEIEVWFQCYANSKVHMANRLITWPMTSYDPERSIWFPHIWMQTFWRALEMALDRLCVLWTLSFCWKDCLKIVKIFSSLLIQSVCNAMHFSNSRLCVWCTILPKSF